MKIIVKNKNIEAIEKIMRLFFKATGLPCVLMDKEGKELLMTSKKVNTMYFLRNLVGDSQYRKKLLRYIELAHQTQDIYMNYFQFGLVLLAGAITHNGYLLGGIIVGPFLLDIPDKYWFKEFNNKLELSIEELQLFDMYYRDTPVISSATSKDYMELLKILIDSLEIDSKKIIYLSSKNRNVTLDLNEKYPIQEEKELLHFLKSSNRAGVNKTINELLGYIYLKNQFSDKEIYFFIIQISILMSRTGIDLKADFDKINARIFEFFSNVYEDNISNSFEYVANFLKDLIDIIFENAPETNRDKYIAQKIETYVQNNYSTNITLDELSDYLEINKNTLSTLFKEYFECGFREYINKVRIENSKPYLRDDRYQIADVAIMMGFNDQSYFSKIFKKHTGMTPGNYKKL